MTPSINALNQFCSSKRNTSRPTLLKHPRIKCRISMPRKNKMASPHSSSKTARTSAAPLRPIRTTNHGFGIHLDHLSTLGTISRLNSRWIPHIFNVIEARRPLARKHLQIRIVSTTSRAITPIDGPIVAFVVVAAADRVASVVAVAADVRVREHLVLIHVVADGPVATIRTSQVVGFSTETAICAHINIFLQRRVLGSGGLGIFHILHNLLCFGHAWSRYHT